MKEMTNAELMKENERMKDFIRGLSNRIENREDDPMFQEFSYPGLVGVLEILLENEISSFE